MSDNEVASFFDEEARSWNRNYEAGGGMLDRASRFRAALAGRIPAGATLLDYGSGTGNIAEALADAGYSVTGVDISGSMIAAARARHGSKIGFRHIAPAGPLPFASGNFDAAIASSVLEYVDDPRQILREIGRVLRPSGWLVLTVPDTRHPLRRREARLSAIVGLPILRHLAGMTRWRRGASYIQLSKNRLTPRRWSELLQECGFAPEPLHTVDTPLLLIAAQNRSLR